MVNAQRPRCTRGSAAAIAAVALIAMLTVDVARATTYGWAQRADGVTGTGDQLAGQSVAISGDGLLMAVGYPGSIGSGQNGAAKVFAWSGSAWVQRGTTLTGAAAGDAFGRALALSRDGLTLAVGAPANDVNGNASGQSAVYRWDGTNWTQLGALINGGTAGDEAGGAVALSADGSTVAIGAIGDDAGGADAGHVRVYGYSGGAWTKLGGDIDGIVASEYLGSAVALADDGTRVAIGSPGYDPMGSTNNGAATVWSWDGSTWQLLGTRIVGNSGGDAMGRGVALSGDGATLATGAPSADPNGLNGAGQATAFVYASSAWSAIGQTVDGDQASAGWGYGVALSLDGRTLAVGTNEESSNGLTYNGGARIYAYRADTTLWAQRGSEISEPTTRAYLGWRAALSSDGAVIALGGPYADIGGTNTGVARAYALVTSPAAPTAVTAAAGDSAATVRWTAPADGGSTITGYTVTARPGGASCTTTGATTCTVTGLANGAEYAFEVTATNAIGTSDPSIASSPVIPAAASAATAATAGGAAGQSGTAARPTIRRTTVRIESARGLAGTAILVKIRVSDAGRLAVTGAGGGATVCRATLRAIGAGTIVMRCGLDANARAAVAETGGLRIRLVARLTTATGATASAARNVVARPIRALPSTVTG